MSPKPKMPKAVRPPKAKTQTYQQKESAVCIVLYDQTGETLSPDAKHEAEDAMLEVAMNHNLLLSISTS
jgi:hypothetical protein